MAADRLLPLTLLLPRKRHRLKRQQLRHQQKKLLKPLSLGVPSAIIDGNATVEDEDTIVYAGEAFHYDDDWAAVYNREGKEERVYLYEFINEPGTLTITIEEWTGDGKDEYKIYIAKKVIPGEITILSRGLPEPDQDPETNQNAEENGTQQEVQSNG